MKYFYILRYIIQEITSHMLLENNRFPQIYIGLIKTFMYPRVPVKIYFRYERKRTESGEICACLRANIILPLGS